MALAAVCEMENSELIAELLQAVNDDVQALKKWSQKVPNTPPPDYRPVIEKLVLTVRELQAKVEGSAAAVPLPTQVNTSAISDQLNRIERSIQHRPDYKMSQYVQYGAYAFGIMVLLLVGMTWAALTWKADRDKFEVSDWKWRAVRQEAPKYADKWDGIFSTDSTATDAQQWTVQQEQADATRKAAQEAAAQAAAMNAQADQLEGRGGETKGKKKH